MKILVIQLARYGDIYQTWPVLRSLKRHYPKSEIHVLVRERFAEGLNGIGISCSIHLLKTRHLLEPLWRGIEGSAECLERQEIFLNELSENGPWNKIINLSFSPYSSFLVDYLRTDSTQVRGYARTHDGYLSLDDKESAYFYAQVGVGKFNRAHLCELFSAIAQVELTEEDWGYKNLCQDTLALWKISPESEVIIIHVSASDPQKSLPWHSWATVVKGITKFFKGEILLVGGPEDKLIADRIETYSSSLHVHNLVGRAQLEEVLDCLCVCCLAIGGDSVLMQMASVVGVKCFNLSCSKVNFWETGPLVPDSRVVVIPDGKGIDLDGLVNEIKLHLENKPPTDLFPMVRAVRESPVHYEPMNFVPQHDFEWDFIQALYLSKDFPLAPTGEITVGFRRLYDLAQLALNQIESLRLLKKKNHQQTLSLIEILSQVDILIGTVGKVLPELSPLIYWFETEKICIGPGPLDEIYEKTRLAFESLKIITSLYVDESTENSLLGGGNDYRHLVS